ncbi:Nucleolysin TIAR, partial [Trichinella pseudospiralis]
LKLYLPITFSSLYIVNSSQCCFCQSLGNCDIFICIAMSYLGNYPSGYSGAYGDATISEEFLLSLFSHIGGVSKCKIIHETASDPYAFVEFVDHASAVQALTAMNKRLLLGKSLNSSSSSGVAVSSDASPVMNNYYSAAYEGLPIFLLPNTKAVLSPLKLQEMRVNWATSPGTQAKNIFTYLSAI